MLYACGSVNRPLCLPRISKRARSGSLSERCDCGGQTISIHTSSGLQSNAHPPDIYIYTLLRETQINGTYGTYLRISLFLPTIFGHIYRGPTTTAAGRQQCSGGGSISSSISSSSSSRTTGPARRALAFCDSHGVFVFSFVTALIFRPNLFQSTTHRRTYPVLCVHKA